MGTKTWKDMTFKLDSSAGAITAYTTFVNQASLSTAMEILDDTALSETVKGKVAGLTDVSIEINGFVCSTTEALLGPVINGTSITKTYCLGNGIKFYTGEGWPADVSFTGQAGQLQTFSFTLQVDGTVTRTSVSL